MSRQPALSSAIRDGRLELAASGSWTAPHAVELESLMDSIAQPTGNGSEQYPLDMGGIGAFDTYGAWLVERLLRTLQTRGHTMQILDFWPTVTRDCSSRCTIPKRRRKRSPTIQDV